MGTRFSSQNFDFPAKFLNLAGNSFLKIVWLQNPQQSKTRFTILIKMPNHYFTLFSKNVYVATRNKNKQFSMKMKVKFSNKILDRCDKFSLFTMLWLSMVKFVFSLFRVFFDFSKGKYFKEIYLHLQKLFYVNNSTDNSIH